MDEQRLRPHQIDSLEQWAHESPGSPEAVAVLALIAEVRWLQQETTPNWPCMYCGYGHSAAIDATREPLEKVFAERDAALAERDALRQKCDEWEVAYARLAYNREQAESELAEARRVLRLVMHDTPCTSSSCHRCVATRAAVAAVLAQEEPL